MSHTLAWKPQQHVVLRRRFGGIEVRDHAPEQFTYRREAGVQHDADMCPPLLLPARIERGEVYAIVREDRPPVFGRVGKLRGITNALVHPPRLMRTDRVVPVTTQLHCKGGIDLWSCPFSVDSKSLRYAVVDCPSPFVGKR